MAQKLKMIIKQKYLLRKHSKKFLSFFRLAVHQSISKDGQASSIEVKYNYKEEVTGLVLKFSAQQFELKFTPWIDSQHPNIIKLLKSQDLSCEEVILDPISKKINLIYNFMFYPVNSEQPYDFSVEGKLENKTLEELGQILDLSNCVNLSYLDFRLQRPDKFWKVLQDKIDAEPDQVPSFFKQLAQSSFWFKNFVDLIDFNLIPKDYRGKFQFLGDLISVANC